MKIFNKSIITSFTATMSLVAVLALTGPAHAGDGGNGALIRGGIGYFDVLDNENSAELHAELMYGQRFYKIFRPFIGVMANTDSAFYGYAGTRLEFDIDDKWQFAPSFAAGGYHQGDSTDLGQGLEFRTALEVNYRLDNDLRIGASLYHLSNAGLDDYNPGTEALTIHITAPIW